MKRIRLTEGELHRIIKESAHMILSEMGTPKQNSFLRKLMGDRYKDEYDNLSVKDSSDMINQELSKAGQVKKEYEVVEDFGREQTSHPCNSFYEAKKKLSEIINDYFNSGWSCVGDVRLVRDSDVRWVIVGRNMGVCGSIYIRKKKE